MIGALTIAALVAFASNSILCRMALGTGAIDPASFTTIRIVSGAVALSPLAVGRFVERKTDGHGDWTSAVALAVYAVAFSFAYVTLSAGIGALLLFGAVQATMIGVALWRGERASLREWSGFGLAVAGLIVLTAPGQLSAPPPLASASMAGAGVAWAIYTLRGRGVIDPSRTTGVNFLRAVPLTIAVSALAAAAGEVIRLTLTGALLAILSGAVTSGLGYVAWYAALRRITAIRAAIVQLAVPALAAAGGVILLGESVTWRLVAASAMILGGVAVAVSAHLDRGRLRAIR